MRSIPRAVIWELLYRGRWVLAAGFIGANFMPVAIEAALSKDGAIDPNDMSQIFINGKAATAYRRRIKTRRRFRIGEFLREPAYGEGLR